MSLRLVPLTLRQANQLVQAVHRHHAPARGCCFVVGVADEAMLVGAAIVGRPVGRGSQDGATCEVTRLATNGYRNACSILYAAAARASAALGYERIQTYILASEPGTSLRAAGWRLDGVVKGRQWTTTVSGQLSIPLVRRTGRPVQDQDKQRWVKDLAARRPRVAVHKPRENGVPQCR